MTVTASEWSRWYLTSSAWQIILVSYAEQVWSVGYLDHRSVDSLSVGSMVRLSVLRSVGLSVSRSFGPSFLRAALQSVGPSVRRSVGPSVRRSVGPSVRRSVGPSVRRPVGPSVRRSVGPSVRRSVGPSVRRCEMHNNYHLHKQFNAACRQHHSTDAALLKCEVTLIILSIDASLLGLSCTASPQPAIILTSPFC